MGRPRFRALRRVVAALVMTSLVTFALFGRWGGESGGVSSAATDGSIVIKWGVPQSLWDAPPSPSSSPPPAALARSVGAPDGDGVVRVVDGIAGPGILLPWVPRRSVSALPLGTASRASIAIVVDNWFGNHHNGLDALVWGGLSNGSALVGPAGGLPNAPVHAPPLPTCWPLNADHTFSHPLQETVKSFPDFNSTSLLQAGGDVGGFVTAQGSARVANLSDPHTLVRVLPWHRLTHNATGDFHSEETAEGAAMLYASMTQATRDAYCKVGGNGLNPDFQPAIGCDGTPKGHPSVRYPYCTRPTAPVAVVSFDCGIVESGKSHDVIVWNVMTLDAGGRAVTYNTHPRWDLPTGVVYEDFDELACAGTSVYPDAPGHLFNEILPRLLHLDTVLPLHIPLLWAPGDLPSRLLTDLIQSGLVSSERQFIRQPKGIVVHRARRLYTYTSDYGSGYTPLIIATSQRLVAARLHLLVQHKHAASVAFANVSAGVAAPPPLLHGGIVVLQRRSGEARAVENQDALMAALHSSFLGVFIDTFLPGEPGFSFVDVASRVYGARIVIGPHGANMNNIVGMRAGAWIVEVGYSDLESGLPSDYFCQARNLGLRYWLSMAESGCYGCPMKVNVADIVEIVQRAFEEG